MLVRARRGRDIYPALDVRPNPPVRSGRVIARELRGRCLLHFTTESRLPDLRHGTNATIFATPTTFTPEEVGTWLQLPGARIPRDVILIIDPERIRFIQGPMWVATGRGIQYMLPEGFPEEAIVVPGAP